MHKLIVYEAKGNYYAFRCYGGGEGLASMMGNVIFTVEAPSASEASEKARIEARKRGISEIDKLSP